MLNNKSGFTLIELIVAIAILGAVAAVSIPQIVRRAQPSFERTQFIARFNALLSFALQQTVMTQKMHKIVVDFGKKKAHVEGEIGGPDARTGQGEFKPVSGAYITPEISIPDNLELKSLFIDNQEELTTQRKDTAQFFFFLVPEGLVQDVIMNLVDKKDVYEGKAHRVGLVLNPFLAQLRVYDSFQKP